MRKFRSILAGGAALAALGAAAPAAAQMYPYGYSNPYAYSNPYGAYGGAYAGYGVNTSVAAQQCTAAVQQRLYARTSTGVGAILGSLFGVNMAPTNARVLGVTRVTPNQSFIRVRGVATSGRVAYNSYGPYGVGAYGALGYSYAPDLSFKCDVDYRGFIRDVDVNRR